MKNLSNLHYLRPPHYKFSGIGNLKFLQEVNGFEVKNDTGYRIEELEHMNDVRILGIRGLENVRDSEEACNAKLCDKRKLMDLSLEWNATRQNIADLYIYARVLDNLEPHHNLKKLMMSNYMGIRPAIWMSAKNLINNLEHIELVGCSEWKNLPPFGHLPLLKSLELRDMPKAEWLFDAGDDCLFPCLIELRLYNCPNLQELPCLPPKLKKLNAMNIGWKTLNFCSISESTLLEELQVLHCRNITYIIGRFTLIRKVEIVDCPNVIPLGRHEKLETMENIPSSVKRLQLYYSEPLQCLLSSLSTMSFLNHLKLKNIPLLKSLPDLPPSLRTTHLECLDNLYCLPSCFPSFSSLNILEIIRVPQLRKLPYLPPFLCRLVLDNLDNLNCLPYYLPSLSSLVDLFICEVPQLRELPNLPPFLCKLNLINLDNLNCLPYCLPRLSSLTSLWIMKTPQLRKLPDLPPSLLELKLDGLDNLNCLPISLSNLPLKYLFVRNVPLLRHLPDLPLSLENLKISKCDPELMKRYREYFDFY